MKFILYSVAAMFFSGLQAIAVEESFGAQERGGGYLRYHDDPSAELILKERDNLKILVNESSTNILNNAFEKPLDKNRLLTILTNLKLSPAVRRTRLNPIGQLDYLIMDYGVDANGSPYIEALEDFFTLIDRRGDSISLEVRRSIFHESLHHFGMDEDMAWSNSKYVSNLGLYYDDAEFALAKKMIQWRRGILPKDIVFTTKEDPSVKVTMHKEPFPFGGDPNLMTLAVEVEVGGRSAKQSNFNVSRGYSYYGCGAHITQLILDANRWVKVDLCAAGKDRKIWIVKGLTPPTTEKSYRLIEVP